MEEKEMVKKSIFRQEIYAQRYEFKCFSKESYFYNSHTVRVQLRDFLSERKIDDKEIFICNLEMPMLEIGEKFYIEEISSVVVIKDRIRTSKENVVYYIENVIIEDEITKQQKDEIERKIFNIDYLEKVIKNKDKEIENLKEKLNKNWVSKIFQKIKGV